MSDKKDLHSFDDVDQKGQALADIESTNNKLIKFIPELNERQIIDLVSALNRHGCLEQDSLVEYGAGFDMGSEIEDQLTMLKALRNRVMVGGKISTDVNIKEAKEVVSLTTTVINSLMKNHEKVQSMERYRAVESAVIATLESLGDEQVVKKYMDELERRLEDLK